MTENNLVVSENNNLFSKAISNFQKVIFLSTKNFKGISISLKRRTLVRIFEKHMNVSEITQLDKKEEIERKYEKFYDLYLRCVNEYITENVYPKVMKGKGSYDENKLIEEYLQIVSLKENDHIAYKYKRQRFLLNRDLYNVLQLPNLYVLEMYKRMYVEKMDFIYKSIIKNYAIKLMEDPKNEKIYKDIFNELEEYITQVLQYKIELDFEKKNDYKFMVESSKNLQKYKYESETVNKIKYIEKNMMILTISRNLFAYSLPIVAAEQCYIKLLKDVRQYIMEEESFNKKDEAYQLLISLIESYNIQLLSKKVYWSDYRIREEYTKFWKEYQRISKLENIDFEEYKRQKQSLFIYYDLKLLNRVDTNKYDRIKLFYRIKLRELKGLRKLKNKYVSLKGKYIKTYVGKKYENINRL